PTGSGTITNTVGTVLDSCVNGPILALPVAKMTFGARATNSAASLRILTSLPPDQRTSIRILRPSTQPNCCRPCRNAAMRACPCAASSTVISAPMRGCPSRCCADAVIGHTAAPPISVMNSRRLIASPEAQDQDIVPAQTSTLEKCPLWVKSRLMRCSNACPLYTRKQTSAVHLLMSVLGHKRTHAVQQKESSSGQLGGAGE